MKTTIITTEALLIPLIDIFNSNYSIPPENEEYEISLLGQFGAINQNPDETVIALPDALPTSLTAARAIGTLLQRSASHAHWIESFTETDPYRFPLQFTYVKRSFWFDGGWQWTRYLTVEYFGEETDVQEAQRQIQLLVDYLRDPENLIRLKPDDLAMF